MRKESFQGILLGIVIMCAVFAFITIAWATFNSTLTINGTAVVNASSWAVEFTNDGNTRIAGSGSATAVATKSKANTADYPATNDLAIQPGGLTVSGAIGSLNGEGDKLSYQWYVTNFGNFNADFTATGLKAENTGSGVGSSGARNLGNVTLTCKYASDNSDASVFCKDNISAKLYVDTYASNSGGLVTPSSALDSTANPLFTLPAATNVASDNTDIKLVTLVVEYVGQDATNNQETASADVNIETTITFTATQSGGMVTTTAPVGP